MSGNADLGERLESYVSDPIESGRSTSRSDVLQEGVRLQEQRETCLLALDKSIAMGLSDADAGRANPDRPGWRTDDREIRRAGEGFVIVVITRAAEADLDEIANLIARANPIAPSPSFETSRRHAKGSQRFLRDNRLFLATRRAASGGEASATTSSTIA